MSTDPKKIARVGAQMDRKAAAFRDHPDKVIISTLELFTLVNLAQVGADVFLCMCATDADIKTAAQAMAEGAVRGISACIADEGEDPRDAGIRLAGMGTALLDGWLGDYAVKPSDLNEDKQETPEAGT